MVDLPPNDHSHLYGNKAYQSAFGLMGAYTRRAGQPLELTYNAYNAAMSSCQIAVEHGFAHVANPRSFNAFESQIKIGEFSLLLVLSLLAKDRFSLIINYRIIPGSSIIYCLRSFL